MEINLARKKDFPSLRKKKKSIIAFAEVNASFIK